MKEMNRGGIFCAPPPPPPPRQFSHISLLFHHQVLVVYFTQGTDFGVRPLIDQHGDWRGRLPVRLV